MALPALPPGKSCVRTAAGWPVGRPSRPAFLNSPASSFFLVHADHRVAAVLMGPGLPADAAELRVPVRVPRALGSPGVALQAEPLSPQQVPDRVRAGLMALAGQLIREI